MAHYICLWILALSFTGPSEASFYPQASWDELVSELRGVDSVSGQATGFFGWPGYFFILSKPMIRVGKEEDFRALLSDEQAVVRCMGLLALAQVKGKAATPTIRSYLYDSAGIWYCREGCCTLGTVVGYFAWNLLLDANHLEYSSVRTPLITESERIGLEIEFLAADFLLPARLDAAEDLPPAIRDGILVLQLPFLRGCAPSLRDFQIIKGLGRLKPSGKQRDFLIACLQDSSLDANARLAAGSALTRHTDDISSETLRKECNALNALDERHWGEQFLETLKARKVHETNMEPLVVERAWHHEQLARILPLLFRTGAEDNGDLLAKRTWQKLEDVQERVVIAYTCGHPLALHDLVLNGNLGIVHDNPDVRRAVAISLIEISRTLKDYSQPWSTYADGVATLRGLVHAERQSESPQMRHLTDAECDEIEGNIAAARSAEQRPAGEKLSTLVTTRDGGM